MRNVILINKELGETPLEALERARKEENLPKGVAMTYAGRLDPMAEGVLLILVGEECKNKEKYLGLDKEYEIEILFGIKTDSHDVLGMTSGLNLEKVPEINYQKYLGKFTQEYPKYSSKVLAMKGLAEEMPTKDVEIYSILELDEKMSSGLEIAKNAIDRIEKVTGDFRQEEIIDEWQAFAEELEKIDFKIVKLRVKCSSGTYMRSLADRIGKDTGVGAIAYSIKRTKIFLV